MSQIATIHCPLCKGPSGVLDTRLTTTKEGKEAVRRRRRCLNCAALFSTREILVASAKRLPSMEAFE